jgi:hypothetical protein
MALFDKDKDKRNKNSDAPDAPVVAADGTVSTDGTVANDIAPLTHPDGTQTVDKAEDKTLPNSEPDEIAPIPDGSVRKAKPAPSSTGYRVEQGKAVSSSTGDTLSDGAEIGPGHVPGGVERLEELVKSGHVVKTEKKGESSSSSASSTSSSASESDKRALKEDQTVAKLAAEADATGKTAK